MDLVPDITSITEDVIEDEEEEREDRISNLPDEIIHHILSFLDMKHVVQTSVLARRWEHMWTSTRYPKLNSSTCRTMPSFAKFVDGALSHLNNHTEVSKVELTLAKTATPYQFTNIVNSVYMHNVRELNLTWLARKSSRFPERLFSSNTLKHLTLATGEQSYYYLKESSIPKVAWDFPALETLFLKNLHLGDHDDESLDLFFKCVNLRDLTLHKCCMHGLQIFNICAPKLSNLTIKATKYPAVVKLVAPKLENFTASVNDTVSQALKLSTNVIDSLEKVTLSLKMPQTEQKRFFPVLLDLFDKLRSTKSLVINADIVQALSLCLDQLSLQTCPLNKLKYLKINMVPENRRCKMNTVPTQVRNYLLENSPDATFIMDMPRVTKKRSRVVTREKIMVFWSRTNSFTSEFLPLSRPSTGPRMRTCSRAILYQLRVHTVEHPTSSSPSSFAYQMPLSLSVEASKKQQRCSTFK